MSPFWGPVVRAGRSHRGRRNARPGCVADGPSGLGRSCRPGCSTGHLRGRCAGQVRCCGSTKLQSLHVLLSDVAGGTAATSASSAFDDRRWKAWHCYRAQPPTAPDRPFNRNTNVPASNSAKSCTRIQGKDDRLSGLLIWLIHDP